METPTVVWEGEGAASGAFCTSPPAAAAAAEDDASTFLCCLYMFEKKRDEGCQTSLGKKKHEKEHWRKSARKGGRRDSGEKNSPVSAAQFKACQLVWLSVVQ